MLAPADTVSTGTSVSVWWWIGGALVAAGAALGMTYGVRRRTVTEDWARSASLTCDIGRAASLTLTTLLDAATVWSRPAHYTEQQQRFTEHVSDLRPTAPDHGIAEILTSVLAANDQLRSAVDRTPDGTPIESARTALRPALDDLATALCALEDEASAIVFGASLPSSRTTG